IFEKQVVEAINIFENLDFIPANLDLANQSESTVVGTDKMLQKFLSKVEENYDVIIIDSNPSFSTLMTNVVLSSDYLVIPIGTSALDEAGAQGFFEIIENVADIYEKFPEKLFVLPTKFDKRRKDDREVLSILENELTLYINSLPNLRNSKFSVLKTIPERAVVKDASASRMFLREYIETYDKTQREFILIFEDIVKKLTEDITTNTAKKAKVTA
ncbi:MAG: ParA family protein, partial [Candidatus Sericytochromatia bacterium]